MPGQCASVGYKAACMRVLALPAYLKDLRYQLLSPAVARMGGRVGSIAIQVELKLWQGDGQGKAVTIAVGQFGTEGRQVSQSFKSRGFASHIDMLHNHIQQRLVGKKKYFSWQ